MANYLSLVLLGYFGGFLFSRALIWYPPGNLFGEGKGTPLQYSCLENPMDGGATWLQSMGSLRVGHDWVTSLSLSCIGEGNSNPLQCSCLDNPRDGVAWWAAVSGVAQSWTWLKRLSSSSKLSLSFYHGCWPICGLVALGSSALPISIMQCVWLGRDHDQMGKA